MSPRVPPTEYAASELAAIVESSFDAIVSKTLDGVITSWNPAAERLYGYTADEAIGSSITLIVPPDRMAEEDEVLRRLRSGETVSHFETVRVRKDGRLIEVSVTMSPVRAPDGRIVGASKIARDISERKALERDRAALLARERAARQAADDANALKDEFLAVLSHELRTPLTSAFGWASLIQKRKVEGEQLDKAVTVIVRSLDMQLRLVNDLLDISALTAGKLRLACESVDLAALIRTETESFRAIAAGAGIQLVEPTAGPLLVYADAARLQQVYSNLLSNAIKFTPKGGRIDVRVEQAGEEVRLVVADTGRGIDPAFLPHVFDKFRQGDSAPSRTVGGLGLGLAIVRSLVELHGGRIWAESAGIGKGTAFVVALPRYDAPRDHR